MEKFGDMNKEELINKMAEAIKKMKEETSKGVIKDHMINSVVNWKTGKEVGQGIVLTCGTKFEYTEEILNHWKEQLGADEFRIKVNKWNLFITFIAYYEEYKRENDKKKLMQAINGELAKDGLHIPTGEG